MIEVTVLDDGTTEVAGAAVLPGLLRQLMDRTGTSPARLAGPTALAGYADDTVAADPLTRLEVDTVAAELADRFAAAEATAAHTATTVVNRWATAVDPAIGLFVDVLTRDEVNLLGAWTNRHYQHHRIAEMNAAGIDPQIGSSCGVDQLLAELVGPAPDDPSEVPLNPATAVFAYLSTLLAAASRQLAQQARTAD